MCSVAFFTCHSSFLFKNLAKLYCQAYIQPHYFETEAKHDLHKSK